VSRSNQKESCFDLAEDWEPYPHHMLWFTGPVSRGGVTALSHRNEGVPPYRYVMLVLALGVRMVLKLNTTISHHCDTSSIGAAGAATCERSHDVSHF
jgi:hypothetical protein